MFGKVLLVVSNFSSMATLYYGLANKEYIISTCIVTTSIISAVFHMLETFEFGSQSVLQLLRLLDFYYSYKSIYVVTTSLFLDYSMEFFYYDIPVQTILITLAVFFTGKDSFLLCIVPMCLGIIAPLLFYYRDRIITINPYDHHLALLITMVLLNIYFYMTETYYDYNIFHSLHHLICFSTPGTYSLAHYLTSYALANSIL